MGARSDTGDDVATLHETAQRILAAFQRREGRATAGDLGDETGESTSNVGYHLRENLAPAGLVRRVGQTETDGPDVLGPANVYALTDRGRAADVEMPQPRDVEDLAAENQALRERIDELEDVVTQIADGLEHAGIAEVNRPE